MKITSTFMAIFMGCAVLAFNACDDNNGSKNKSKELRLLAVLGSSGVACSGGGPTYAIGCTGPSGVGIVFYITDGGLHGLEAAPSGWYAASGDPTADAWISGTYQTTFIGTTGTAIGTGSANTDAIIAQTGESPSAADLCRAYTGGGKIDWFLPSKDELYQLYLQRSVVGGFATCLYCIYWSSSESIASSSWGLRYGNGIQGGYDKGNWTFYVRPVRAF
jgi:hypothetical protein